MATVAIVYVPPLPMEGYNQANAISLIDPLFAVAKKKKKDLAYIPVKGVTVILKHDKNLAIVKWLPLLSNFIMFGSESIRIETKNSFGRNTFGSFSVANNNDDAIKFVFSPEAEFDIHNFEISGSLDFNYHINQFSEMFELAVNSPYSEYPYCMPFDAFSNTIGNTTGNFPEPEKSYINVLDAAQKSMVTTGTYNEPSSNIVYVEAWMKIHLRSLFSTMRFYTSISFLSNHPDGPQTFSILSRLFTLNTIYKKDIVHFKDGNNGFFTFSMSSFLDDLTKHINKDTTGSVGDTFVGSVVKDQVIPFTVPGVPSITTGVVFVSGDTESITTFRITSGAYSFENTQDSTTGGFNEETQQYDVNVSYGIYTFNFQLLFGTFLYHTIVGFDLNDIGISIADDEYPAPLNQTILSPQFYITNAGGVGQSRAADASSLKVGGGAFQSFVIITTAQGFEFNHSELTATGIKTFSGAGPESGQVGSHIGNTFVIRFPNPGVTTVSTSLTDNLRTHLFGKLVPWSTSSFSNNTGLNSVSSGYPIPLTLEDNHILNVQHSMDGRTLFKADLAGNVQRTHIADGIFTDPFLMSWVSPPGISIGTLDISLDTADAGNNWRPHGTGRHIRVLNSSDTYSPNGAGWQTYRQASDVRYHGTNGQWRITSANRIGNDGQGQLHTTGIKDNSQFGGLRVTGIGSTQIDVHLVDNDLKRTGIFSMLVDPSLGDPSALLAAFLINQREIVQQAEALADPDYKIYVKSGSTDPFIPALDGNGDYLYEPPESYLDLLTETLGYRIQLDALLAQVVVRNDFMSYELLHIWFNYVTVNRPLSSYIMHTNTLEIPSVTF